VLVIASPEVLIASPAGLVDRIGRVGRHARLVVHHRQVDLLEGGLVHGQAA
jgi:hypothetical protein